jgi:hypothetical protein
MRRGVDLTSSAKCIYMYSACINSSPVAHLHPHQPKVIQFPHF